MLPPSRPCRDARTLGQTSRPFQAPKCPSAGRCYGWQVKVGASREALDFILEHGGRLYVWADRRACCGGTRFIRSSTEPPGKPEGFALFDLDGVELYLKAAAGRLPDELDVD